MKFKNIKKKKKKKTGLKKINSKTPKSRPVLFRRFYSIKAGQQHNRISEIWI